MTHDLLDMQYELFDFGYVLLDIQSDLRDHGIISKFDDYLSNVTRLLNYSVRSSTRRTTSHFDDFVMSPDYGIVAELTSAFVYICIYVFAI